jgi:hypothetical protein
MRATERLTRVGYAALMVGLMTVSNACANDPKFPTSESKPGISTTISPDSEKAQWESLLAIERLNSLLAKSYPTFPDFNRQKEVTLATAQAYCEQTHCNKPPDEMARAVRYLEEDDYITMLAEEEYKRPLTKEEIKMEKESRLATTIPNGNTYINRALMETLSKENKGMPEVVSQLDGQDFDTLFEISIGAHEFTHRNSKKQSKKFDSFSIELTNAEGPINFDTLDKFKIKGKDSGGNPKFIVGGDEAIVDLATKIIIEKKMGLKYFSAPKYILGGLLVIKLNIMANIPDEEFLNYANGKLPSEKLLKKWGAFKYDTSLTDLKAGVLALRDIGLAVDGFITFPSAETDINRILKLENP